MSRKDREEWEAWLAADPALRAAWDGFRAALDRASRAALAGSGRVDLGELRSAADLVMREGGDGQTKQ